MLALPVDEGRAVAYSESIVAPSQPVPSTSDSPFRELRVALYASPRADPSALLITTEADLPLTGRVESLPFAVGADEWPLVVGDRAPLAGSLARNLPWFVLAGGLMLALLIAALVETLSRRRGYAMALVAERTRDLEGVLGELGETRWFLERLLTAGPVLVGRATVSDQRVTYVSPNIERSLWDQPRNRPWRPSSWQAASIPTILPVSLRRGSGSPQAARPESCSNTGSGTATATTAGWRRPWSPRPTEPTASWQHSPTSST